MKIDWLHYQHFQCPDLKEKISLHIYLVLNVNTIYVTIYVITHLVTHLECVTKMLTVAAVLLASTIHNVGFWCTVLMVGVHLWLQGKGLRGTRGFPAFLRL